jgi:MinD-like ATPase involved in chromosome partitioning or flagellar assembly
MAKYVTYIADPELESSVLKAIATTNGELIVRGVSIEQIREAEKTKEAILICTRQIEFTRPKVIVDKSMSVEEIVDLLTPQSPKEDFTFNSGAAKVICLVGLSGGVGTTTIAINHAFELSQRFKVVLSDLDVRNPDIARALGLHRIEERIEKISKNLSVIQGMPTNADCEIYVFDIGANLNHPLLKFADEIILVARTGFNTLVRMQKLDISPKAVIFNFAERTKAQQRWRGQIAESFPKLDIVNIPFDLKSFEASAENRSALLEVAGNSLARKSIATLG